MSSRKIGNGEAGGRRLPGGVREWAARLSLAAGSVALTIVILEAAFRLTGAERKLFPVMREDMPTIRTKYRVGAENTVLDVHLTNRPATAVRFHYPDDPRGYFDNNAVEARFNALGFRGPEFPVGKGAKAIRIAFLGDSFTMGQGVKFPDTYPERIAAALNRRYAARGLRVEAHNFGVGGSNAFNDLQILALYGRRSAPDLVVLGYSLNDVEPNLTRVVRTADGYAPERVRRPLDYFEGSRFRRTQEGVYAVSAAARIAREAVAAIRSRWRILDYYRDLYGEGNREWRDRNLRALDDIAALCRADGVPLVALVLPVIYRLDDHPFRDLHAGMVRFFESRGVPAIDMAGPLRGYDHRDLWVHEADHHPNEKAHALFAAHFVERAAPLLDAVADRRERGGTPPGAGAGALAGRVPGPGAVGEGPPIHR